MDKAGMIASNFTVYDARADPDYMPPMGDPEPRSIPRSVESAIVAAGAAYMYNVVSVLICILLCIG